MSKRNIIENSVDHIEQQIAVARNVATKRWSALAALAAFDRGDWSPGDPLPERPEPKG